MIKCTPNLQVDIDYIYYIHTYMYLFILHVTYYVCMFNREQIQENAEGHLQTEDEIEAYKIKRRKYTHKSVFFPYFFQYLRIQCTICLPAYLCAL